MDPNRKFSLRNRARSFGYAFQGIMGVFRQEHNMLLHLLATLAVIVLCIIFPVTRTEIIALVFSIGFVWVSEIFNTAIEKIMDLVSPQRDPGVKLIKDISAAAVLIAAVTALVVGCLVFIPKFL